MLIAVPNVRFRGQRGHHKNMLRCPLLAQSRHPNTDRIPVASECDKLPVIGHLPTLRGKCYVRRRDFIKVVASSAAWPAAVYAQQPQMPVIGFINLASARNYT